MNRFSLITKPAPKMMEDWKTPGPILLPFTTDGFSLEYGPATHVFNCSEPVDFLNRFLNTDMMDLIVNETNRRGKQEAENRGATFQETTKMREFLGICL